MISFAPIMPSRLPSRLVKSADVLVDVVLFMLSILAGVVSYYDLPAKTDAQIERSLLIALGVFLVTLTAHQTFRSITAEDKLSDISGAFGEILNLSHQTLEKLDFLASEQRIRDLRRSLNEREDLIQKAGLKTVDEYLALICSSRDVRGIKVQGEQLALAAYENLWISLVEHQAQFKNEPAKNGAEHSLGAIRITHSTSMDVWSTDVGLALLRYQRDYVRDGGVIVRILLDRPASPTPEVQKIMETMTSYGIHVYYLECNEIEKLVSDFLWVGPYELSWRTDMNHKSLEECELTQTSRTRQAYLRRTWSDLGSRVVDKHPGLPERIKHILTSPAVD